MKLNLDLELEDEDVCNALIDIGQNTDAEEAVDDAAIFLNDNTDFLPGPVMMWRTRIMGEGLTISVETSNIPGTSIHLGGFTRDWCDILDEDEWSQQWEDADALDRGMFAVFRVANEFEELATELAAAYETLKEHYAQLHPD